MGKYDNIINLPHHTSNKHRRMADINRAAQFAPFAALSGYDKAIMEQERYREQKRILSDESIEEINRTLNLILGSKENKPQIRVLYFRKDEKKPGGNYISLTGYLKKIDVYEKALIMADKTKIFFEDIAGIEIIK